MTDLRVDTDWSAIRYNDNHDGDGDAFDTAGNTSGGSGSTFLSSLYPTITEAPRIKRQPRMNQLALVVALVLLIVAALAIGIVALVKVMKDESGGSGGGGDARRGPPGRNGTDGVNGTALGSGLLQVNQGMELGLEAKNVTFQDAPALANPSNWPDSKRQCFIVDASGVYKYSFNLRYRTDTSDARMVWALEVNGVEASSFTVRLFDQRDAENGGFSGTLNLSAYDKVCLTARIVGPSGAVRLIDTDASGSQFSMWRIV